MGWASGGAIFDPICEALQNAHMDPVSREKVLVICIKAFQDGDWDTEEESLERFRKDPLVVRAFEKCGICLYGSIMYKRLNGWSLDDEEDYKRWNDGRSSWEDFKCASS